MGYPEPPLDLNQAADRLGISRRTLSAAIQSLRHYELRGRKKVFYPEHIAALRKEMHECASNSSGGKAGPISTAPHLMASGSENLQKLAILCRPKRSVRH